MTASINILAFETSTSTCSVALQHGDKINILHKHAPMQQAHLILPMIQELLSSFSLTLQELDAIAYGCGPGSFTGIRIANSVAQGIGFVTQKPIIPVSSLAILAQTAYLEQQWAKVLVAMDARMGQVYWAAYEVDATGVVTLNGKEQLVAPQAIILPEEEGVKGIGDGWEIYKEIFAQHLEKRSITVYAALLPSAKALIQLAKAKFKRGEWTTAVEATPVYLAGYSR